MVKGNQKRWFIFVLVAFFIYIFAAARPISEETILEPRWISSLESNHPIILNSTSAVEHGLLLPFSLGDRFGYVGDEGTYTINQSRSGYVSMSETHWAEYEAQPASIQVMNPWDETVLLIENTRGYPLFLDNHIYIVGSEQNSITAIGPRGEELWIHDFPAPVTCIDASGGFVLAGTLDGALELLNPSGRPVFPPFEPGGSRLTVILGCAISRDASRVAIVSGIDEQRFLVLEKTGDLYQVVYHEFLSNGFRRPVYINFVSNDSKVIYEREGGIGIYDISSRRSLKVDLNGEIVALDNSGEGNYLFVVTSQGPSQKSLITIRYPGIIVNEAPFLSERAFLTRRNTKLYLGSDSSIVSFELEKR